MMRFVLLIFTWLCNLRVGLLLVSRVHRAQTHVTIVCSFDIFIIIISWACRRCRSQLIIVRRLPCVFACVRMNAVWTSGDDGNNDDNGSAKFINLSRNGNIIIHSRDMPKWQQAYVQTTTRLHSRLFHIFALRVPHHWFRSCYIFFLLFSLALVFYCISDPALLPTLFARNVN